MAERKDFKESYHKSPERFVRHGLDEGRYEGVYNERKRLNDVRDIFFGTQSASGNTQIPLADGGCFHPAPINILKKMIDTAFNLNDYAAQIYPQQNALPAFLGAIWNYFKNDCDIDLRDDAHSIAFGYGSAHLYDVFLSVVANPGDIILMPESYYHSISEWPAKWHAEARCIKTGKENAYKLTAQDLKQWCNMNPELVDKICNLVITNPTSTGAIYSAAEIEELAAICEEYDFLVYSDEVYRDSSFDMDKVRSLASHPKLLGRTVTSNSGSKSKNVADFRIGWCCGPKEIVDRMVWHLEHSLIGLPLYLQEIGTEILKTKGETLALEKLESQKRIQTLSHLIAHSNLRLKQHFSMDMEIIKIVNLPQAGNNLCLDFSALKGWKIPGGGVIHNSEDLCRYFYGHTHESEMGVLNHGVCFSCGYSKGHDDIILYVSYSQPGYKFAGEAAKPHYNYELAHHTLRALAKDDIDDAEIEQALTRLGIAKPDIALNYSKASQSAQQILTDAFDRVVCALRMLMPSSAAK